MAHNHQELDATLVVPAQSEVGACDSYLAVPLDNPGTGGHEIGRMERPCLTRIDAGRVRTVSFPLSGLGTL